MSKFKVTYIVEVDGDPDPSAVLDGAQRLVDELSIYVEVGARLDEDKVKCNDNDVCVEEVTA